MDDLGGWGPKAWDLLQDRVDAIRADVNVLMGREVPHDEEERERVTFLGWGLSNWTALVAAIGAVLAAIAGILGKGS